MPNWQDQTVKPNLPNIKRRVISLHDTSGSLEALAEQWSPRDAHTRAAVLDAAGEIRRISYGLKLMLGC